MKTDAYELGHMTNKVIVCPLTQSYSMTISNISSKATGPVVTKFHVEPPGTEWTKMCSNRPGHMTGMATAPIYGKTFKNLQL